MQRAFSFTLDPLQSSTHAWMPLKHERRPGPMVVWTMSRLSVVMICFGFVFISLFWFVSVTTPRYTMPTTAQELFYFLLHLSHKSLKTNARKESFSC